MMSRKDAAGRFLVVLSLMLIGAILSSCSSEYKPQKTIENGVPTFANSGEGKWAGRMQMKLAEMARFGEGDDEMGGLVLPVAVDVDQDGNVYVLDQGAGMVKVYTEKGAFKCSMGQPGNGPGEFRNPVAFTLVKDSLLVVADLGRKISFFSLEGEFRSSFMVKEGMPQSLCSDETEGLLYVTFTVMPFLPEERQLKNVVYVYTYQGELVDAFGEMRLMGELSAGKQFSSALVTWNKLGTWVAYECLYRVDGYDAQPTKKIGQVCEADFFSKPELMTLDIGIKMFNTRSRIKYANLLADDNLLLTMIDLGPNYLEEMAKAQSPTFMPEEFKVRYGVYDKELTLLGHFTADHVNDGGIVHVDSQGFAYAVSMPDQTPVVKKFQITVE